MAGVPMAGVINYPFKVNERLYYDDFAGAISSRITHPYLTTAKPTGSLPFNVLSNSAAESSVSGWVSLHTLRRPLTVPRVLEFVRSSSDE